MTGSELGEYDSTGDLAFTKKSLHGINAEPMYSGVLSFMRRSFRRDLTDVDIAVTGIPYDLATSGRSGTRLGPQAIRRASVNLAWGEHYPSGLDVFEKQAVIDYGDLVFNPGYPDKIPEAIYQHAKTILDAGPSMLTMGGDHFISYPLIKAHAEQHGPLALVQFDAHSDTWAVKGNPIDHGSMFYQAIADGLILPEKSLQIGIRTHNHDTLGVTTLGADVVHSQPPAQLAEKICNTVGKQPAYLSFDIDCLDPAFAPGTGTPVCGGLSNAQAQMILRGLGQINFVGMDIVEVSPAFDHSDITALAASHIALEYLALQAAKR